MKTEVLRGRLVSRGGWLTLAAALVLVLPLGCGGGDGGGETDLSELTPDQMDIRSRVDGVSDMSSELTRLRKSFTKKNSPKSSDKKKYSANNFEIAGDIVVTDNSASFPVKMKNYKTGAEVEKQWKAEKVDDKWLLSDTPLP